MICCWPVRNIFVARQTSEHARKRVRNRTAALKCATCGDTFGTKYATTNAGLLYTAKGTAALIVPYTSIIQTMTGSWHAVDTKALVLTPVQAAMIADSSRHR